MPSFNGYQRHHQYIHHTDRQQVFPLQVQQLVDPQPWESPPEPHDHEDEEEGFPKEPNWRRDVIHYMIEPFPVANMEWHPSSKEQRSANGTNNEHIDILREEE